jgi:hypothetical protein
MSERPDDTSADGWASGAAVPLSDEATELEAERFRSIELRQSLDGCTRRVAELAAALVSAEQRARTVAEGFLEYARHRDECPMPPAKCSCGYDDALAVALGASPEGRGSATP